MPLIFNIVTNTIFNMLEKSLKIALTSYTFASYISQSILLRRTYMIYIYIHIYDAITDVKFVLMFRKTSCDTRQNKVEINSVASKEI